MPLVAGWGIECKKSCAFPLPLNRLRGPSSYGREPEEGEMPEPSRAEPSETLRFARRWGGVG